MKNNDYGEETTCVLLAGILTMVFILIILELLKYLQFIVTDDLIIFKIISDDIIGF